MTYPDLLEFLPDKRFSVITAARQTGKTSLLRTLYTDWTKLKNACVRRDVQESKIMHELKFYRMFQLLADQIGNLLNKHALAGEIQLDSKTVDNLTTRRLASSSR